MKILITGFDPFGGEKVNPAYKAIELIESPDESIKLLKLELPTVFYKSLELLKATIVDEQPDAVVCVGQAGGRNNISIEKVAINLNEARIEDNQGQMPMDESIYEDGETAYFSNLPIKAMVRDLVEHDIPASVSYSAGTYVCNHIFYGLMYLINKEFKDIKGGFVHVPYLPEQVLYKANQPYMSLHMIVDGLKIILKTINDHDEDIVYRVGETH